MAYELIITEKPSTAKKVAEALADTSAVKKNNKRIPFYELKHKGKLIVVGCAVGHVFGLAENKKDKKWTYPVYDVEWKPSYEVDKKSAHTKDYIDTIKKLAKDANKFTVATDYDIEGEVIGLNIIRYACKQKDARRMKFSTLTKDELVKSYENASPTLNWGQATAGETRHELDWYYGINISRALTLAVKAATKAYKLLSSGRVQGPSLKILVDKEKEIQAFVPKKFWQIQLLAETEKGILEAWHKEDKFWEKEKADKVMEKIKGKKEATVTNLEKTEFKQQPPVPFDLTTLQTEAYRLFKIKPKETLELAQNLYIGGYTSYPRTSSQKLPASLEYKKILKKISENPDYTKKCEIVLSEKVLKPNEGKKEDDAHPAIHPTGEMPKKLSPHEQKMYDLVVKRFLATFGDDALRETNTITIEIEQEPFIAKGTITREKGWHTLYEPYVKLEEEELPILKKAQKLPVKDITQHEKETQPPNRYNPASLIRELEKLNLGTKATRSAIIENLYNRGYIKEERIEVTELGMKTDQVLEKYVPEIVDPELTRHFEDEMEQIRKKETTQEKVLEEARTTLNKILKDFDKKKEKIGLELSEANKTTIITQNVVGRCPNCADGMLSIRFGKYGRFIGCTKYPDCKTIFKVPPKGMLKPTGKTCPECGHPIVFIKEMRFGKEVCINPKCPTWSPDYKKKTTQ